MAVNPLAIGGGVVAAAAVVGGGLYAGGVFGGSSTGQSLNSGGTPPKESEIRKAQWYSLSDETAYSSTGTSVETAYGSKWGEKYSKYLIGVGGARTGTKVTDNTKLWTKKYADFEKAKPQSGKFSTVTEAHGDKATSLSKVCESAYKAEKTKVTTAGSGTDDFKESEVWSFCSLGATQIKTLKEESAEKATYNATDAFGGKSDYEEKLVSIKDVGSDWFWDLKEKEFFEATANPADTDKAASEFKRIWSEKKTEYTKLKTTRFVKEVCEAAYKAAVASSEGNETKYTKSDVGKFCTLDGKALS